MSRADELASVSGTDSIEHIATRTKLEAWERRPHNGRIGGKPDQLLGLRLSQDDLDSDIGSITKPDLAEATPSRRAPEAILLDQKTTV